MNTDLDRLSAVIAGGIAAGDFEIEDPGASALQMLSLIDGLSVQAATRGILDYTPVRAMVIATTERLLALPPGALTPVMEDTNARRKNLLNLFLRTDPGSTRTAR